MTNRFEEVYRFGSDDFLTDEALNRRFRDVDDRLSKAEIARLSEDQAFALVLDRVLGRSEAVIASLRDSLLQITELQWLTARSDTSRTLAVDTQFALQIVEADRALFAPGPYALLSWTGGSPTDYAIVRTLGYDRLLGQWDVRIEAFTGEPGPWTDWQIAAVAGATLAQMALLVEGKAVRAETVTARNVANQHRADAAEAQTAAETARTGAGTYRGQTQYLRDETAEIRGGALAHRTAAEDAAGRAEAAAEEAAASAEIVNPEALNLRLSAIEADQARSARIRQSWYLGA